MSSCLSRILLVEDDPEQAQLFTLILSAAGNEVITTPDAESAMSLLAKSPDGAPAGGLEPAGYERRYADHHRESSVPRDQNRPLQQPYVC